MALVFVAVLIGVTLGIATWALIRGRGGLIGATLCCFFASVGALAGGLAADALFAGASRMAVAVGATVGAVAVSLVEAIGFGPRPKRVRWADSRGVATHQPNDGSVPRSRV